MATYTHLTFLFFWLIMISIANVVLPVCRSPMINSRWPLPMGNIASIAKIPVASGSSTDFLSITPKGIFSIGIKWSFLIFTFPSCSWPKAFTIRPNSWSPTGIEIIFFVLLTTLFSKILLYFPNITIPTELDSKFKTKP